ncbi:MAG TPA: hypothetical protein VEU96_01515 [Bryobacteraceae bacterium]|nr:hypothetical protein [Bryobacteraceae bacterium]
MDELIKNLTPLFVAGLAIQQLVELPDAILSQSATYEKYKKPIIRIIAIVFGMWLVIEGNFSVIKAVGGSVPVYVDRLLSALIVSGGTESFNSIIKFMGYAKDDKKTTVAAGANPENSAQAAQEAEENPAVKPQAAHA